MSIILALAVCLTLYTPAFAISNSYSNFSKQKTYSNQFTDVDSNAWYADAVQSGYEYGFISGISATTFAPSNNLSIAEAITLACRIYSLYTTGSDPVLTSEAGDTWYDPYVRYALANDIISTTYNNYSALAARSDIAVIFTKALPAEALTAIRTVEDNAIPDVSSSASYASSVYLLYRAGILSGSDDYGTFNPNTNITRSEIAAICVRLATPAERSSTALSTKLTATETVLTATEISDKCSSSVFYIGIYGMSGNLIGSGSGFFISADGLALTNYHVAADSSCLTATTTDGTVYSDIDIIDYDEDNDLVLLRVNGVSNHSYISLGDSSDLKQGQTVYAIGSPLGLSNTMSTGIVSNVARVLGDTAYIQISAQITYGSSGGALVNEYGEAIGVTCGGFDTYGDINLAVPINFAKQLNTASTHSYYVWSDSVYSGYDYAIDFGTFAGILYVKETSVNWGTTYTYSMADFSDSPIYDDASNYGNTMYYYNAYLQDVGLAITSETDDQTVYNNGYEQVVVNLDYSSFIIEVTVTWIPQYYSFCPTVLDFGWFASLYLADYLIDNEGITLKYTYDDDYTYNDMTTIINSYASYLSSSGCTLIYYGTGEDCLFWLCEGDGLSIVIMQEAATAYLDIQTSDSQAAATGFSNCPSVPDFGEYFGVSALYANDIMIGSMKVSTVYGYSVSDLTMKGDGTTFFDIYWELLNKWGFSYITAETDDAGSTIYVFQNFDIGYEISYSVSNGIVHINIFYSLIS